MWESPDLLALKAPQSVPIPRPALSSQNRKGDSYLIPGCHMVPCGPCSGGWPGLNLLVPVSPGRKGRGSLCVRQGRQEEPGLQHSPTSLAQQPCLPVFLPSVFAHMPAFSNPHPRPVPGPTTAWIARSVQVQETRGSASGTLSPWAQGHSGDSPLGPMSPFQGSCCPTYRSRLGESSSLPHAPHPTSPTSPPPPVHLSVSLQSYLSLASPLHLCFCLLAPPGFFLPLCLSPSLFPADSASALCLFVSISLSPYLRVCVCVSLCVSLSVPDSSLPLSPLPASFLSPAHLTASCSSPH